MKFISLSPMMSSDEHGGHYYWAYRSLEEESTALDFDTLFIGPKSEGYTAYLPVLFRRNSNLGFYSRSDSRTIAAISSYVNKSESCLFHFYDGGIADIIFVSRLIQVFPNSRVMLNLHWADSIAKTMSSKKRISKIQVKIFQFIIEMLGYNVILTAESDLLANIASQKLERDVSDYPVYSIHNKSTNEKKIIEYILVTFDDKTAKDVLLAISLSYNFSQNCEVVILTNSQTAKEISNFNYSNVSIKIIESPLSKEQYCELHKSAKVLILPYLKGFYNLGSSGRLLDARMLGCNVVVPDDLALSSKSLDLGIGFTYQREIPESLQYALRQALQVSPKDMDPQIFPNVTNALKWIERKFLANSPENIEPRVWRRIKTSATILQLIVEIEWGLLQIVDLLRRNIYILARALKLK